jgi:hypothetical protein
MGIISDERAMKKLLLCFSLLFSFNLYAQKAQVLILDDDIDASSLERNFHVHRGSSHVSSLPNKTERDEALKDLKEIQKWEEFKKDLLFMDIKSKSLTDLSKKYPEIPAKQLKEIKDEL